MNLVPLSTGQQKARQMLVNQRMFGTRKCMDDEKLAHMEEEFRRTAEYVLLKNAELYRRLS